MCIGAGIGGVLGGGIYALTHRDDFDWGDFAGATAKGTLIGAGAGYLAPAGASFATSLGLSGGRALATAAATDAAIGMGYTYAVNTVQCQPTSPTDLLLGAAGGGLGSLAGPGWRWGKGLFSKSATTAPRRFGPGAAHADDPAFGTARTTDGSEVSLFKAPQRGQGQHQHINGYRMDDFPGDARDKYAMPDGHAYFAADRSIAEEYAKAYGEGIIEIKIPALDYDQHFRQYHRNYHGSSDRQQVPIPNYDVEKLNGYPRMWHK
jgi:hypothetical protein